MTKCAAIFVMLAAVPFTQCLGPKDGQVCTEVYVYGVTVNVTDAQTGAAIEGATLTLHDGNYVEVMQPFPSGGYVGAGERPGTYTLTVEAAGYQTVVIDSIIIQSDPCHVIPVTKSVTLQPK